METHQIAKKTNLLRALDLVGFTLLTLFLVVTIFMSGSANIQTDSIDYYAILQKLTAGQTIPIVNNLPFLEQRSPGYPIFSMIPYYITSAFVEPFVQTEVVSNTKNTSITNPEQSPSESMLIPSEPLLIKDIFFKNIVINPQGNQLEWKLLFSLLITSYSFFFIGLYFLVKTLKSVFKNVWGATLIPLTIITMPIFMHNLINTPTYATLTAFGLSCIFGYFFIKGSVQKSTVTAYLSGLFLGLLVLTRLETILLAIVVFVGLVICKEFRSLRNIILGALIPAVILLFYNLTQFGNPFHLAILKGTINLIMLDFRYIFMNVIDPRSGIFFFSTLGVIGILALFFDKHPYCKILGAGSLCMIFLILIRVPVMFTCVGEGIKMVSGLPVTCPKNLSEMAMLVRFDANRYITVLIPFSIFGLRSLISHLPSFWNQILAFFSKSSMQTR
jgi:hypothetical protein